MNRLRRWRIRRCYRRVAKLELKVGDLSSAELRKEFVSETLAMIDNHFKRKGWSRQQRRSYKREVVAGR